MSLKTFKEILNESNPAESKQQALFEKVYFECNVKPLYEQVLKEAELASDTMINFIDNFFYEIARDTNYRKTNEPFDFDNFHIHEMIKKIYEKSCGDEFLRFIEPPEEDRWILRVIDELRRKLNSVSDHNRDGYNGLINYIVKHDLLRTALNEVRTEHQQRIAQNQH